MKKYTSVEEYFADQDGRHLEMLHEIRDLILELAPDAQPAISSGLPAYKTDIVLAGMYAYKNHISFYPQEAGLLAQHADLLKDYKFTKSTLQIGIDQDLPAEAIRQMIRTKIQRHQEQP